MPLITCLLNKALPTGGNVFLWPSWQMCSCGGKCLTVFGFLRSLPHRCIWSGHGADYNYTSFWGGRGEGCLLLFPVVVVVLFGFVLGFLVVLFLLHDENWQVLFSIPTDRHFLCLFFFYCWVVVSIFFALPHHLLTLVWDWKSSAKCTPVLCSQTPSSLTVYRGNAWRQYISRS